MENYVRLGLIVLHVLILSICVIGNLFVCFFFTLDNKKLKHLQLLIFYLAVFDLLAGMLGPLLFIYLEITNYQRWDFGEVGCKIVPYLWKVLTSISFGLIMLISIDRCIAICRPFHSQMSKMNVHKSVFLIGVLSIIMESPDLIYAKKTGGNCEVPFVGSPGYAYAFLSIHCIRDIGYLATFIVSYVLIQKDLFNQSCLKLPGINRTSENKAVLKMLFVVGAVFVILTFPRDLLHITYVFSWLVGRGIVKTDSIVAINSMVTVLLSCNRISNVFIYAKLHRRFRNTLREKARAVLSFGYFRTNSQDVVMLISSSKTVSTVSKEML